MGGWTYREEKEMKYRMRNEREITDANELDFFWISKRFVVFFFSSGRKEKGESRLFLLLMIYQLIP